MGCGAGKYRHLHDFDESSSVPSAKFANKPPGSRVIAVVYHCEFWALAQRIRPALELPCSGLAEQLFDWQGQVGCATQRQIGIPRPPKCQAVLVDSEFHPIELQGCVARVVLADYKVLRRIDATPTATVLKVQDAQGRRFAAKRIDKATTIQPRAGYVNEIKILSELQGSKHVVELRAVAGLHQISVWQKLLLSW